MEMVHTLIAVVSVLSLSLQGDVRQPSSDKPPIVVEGCVQGRTLKVTRAETSGVERQTYRLKLSKALARALKEHENHEEEITGVVSDTARAMGGTRSKTVGSKTTITVGARETRNTGALEDPQLEVSAFRHLNPTCGSPRTP
jgi:hypothetical protein